MSSIGIQPAPPIAVQMSGFHQAATRYLTRDLTATHKYDQGAFSFDDVHTSPHMHLRCV